MAYITKYPNIPRIDVHNHLGRRLQDDPFDGFLKVRERVLKSLNADVALMIDLDGGFMTKWVQDPLEGIKRINKNGKNRFIPVLSDAKPAQEIKSFKPGQAEEFKTMGYAGLKMHWAAGFNGGVKAPHGLINDAYFDPYFKDLEKNKMPLVCLHLEAPWGDSDKQREALFNVMTKFPNLIVIHAHFGVQTWKSLDEQGKVFDKFPNYYRDISTTAQHIESKYGYSECRDFFIKYSDRLLYATDNIASHKNIPIPIERFTNKYLLQFEFYETDNDVSTNGIGVVKPRTPPYVKGLNLPENVLKNIYFNNAIRLIPHVKEKIQSLGYKVDLPPPTDIRPKPIDPIDPIDPKPISPKVNKNIQTLIQSCVVITQDDINTANSNQKQRLLNQIKRITNLIIT